MGCRALPVAMLAAAMAAGCASFGETPGEIAVGSEPAGADVYVMGRKVGVTPMVVHQSAVFPLTYPPAQQTLYGLVELRKAGCKPVAIPVGVRAVAKGVNVTLDCGEASPAKAATLSPPAAAQPTRPPPAPPGEPSPAPPAPAAEARPAPPAEPLRKPLPPTSAAIEERLRRVQELRERGVITEQEAQAARQRILGEL